MTWPHNLMDHHRSQAIIIFSCNTTVTQWFIYMDNLATPTLWLVSVSHKVTIYHLCSPDPTASKTDKPHDRLFAISYIKRTAIHFTIANIDGLVQERRNSIANALELRLSCTNPSIWYDNTSSINYITVRARVSMSVTLYAMNMI